MMKKLVLTCLASAALLSARAQLFSPEALGGAFWGAMIGGLAGGGHHGYSHHGNYCSSGGFSGEGAAIGAGVGLLAGALVGEARRQDYYHAQPVVYVPAPATTATVGYGYSSRGSSASVYYAPNAYPAPDYYYHPSRPNYAVGGTLLGAASGALIGEGTQGKPGEGAAIGAAAGLVLGGIAEHAARKQEQRIAAAQPAVQTQWQQPAQTTPPQDERLQTPDARSEITSRPSANSTYYWTAPPRQIADAPSVPDAPRF